MSDVIVKDATQYNFVVSWSEYDGWTINWDEAESRFDDGKTIYIPNLDEWVRPSMSSDENYYDSETGRKEAKLTLELSDILSELNK